MAQEGDHQKLEHRVFRYSTNWYYMWFFWRFGDHLNFYKR